MLPAERRVSREVLLKPEGDTVKLSHEVSAAEMDLDVFCHRVGPACPAASAVARTKGVDITSTIRRRKDARTLCRMLRQRQSCSSTYRRQRPSVIEV